MEMADTATNIHVTQVATVIVCVSDQDRAIEFFVGALGFEQTADFRYGADERWVEVAPPGGATRISLARPRDGWPTGIETGVAFSTEDVDADHAELRARGVDVDDAVLRRGDPPVTWSGATLAGVPSMFRFRDPDGNSFLMVQRS
jgi:catechol 2,3-dioxygenase-like lactoylglutathione lyase family enzyme